MKSLQSVRTSEIAFWSPAIWAQTPLYWSQKLFISLSRLVISQYTLAYPTYRESQLLGGLALFQSVESNLGQLETYPG